MTVCQSVGGSARVGFGARGRRGTGKRTVGPREFVAEEELLAAQGVLHEAKVLLQARLDEHLVHARRDAVDDGADQEGGLLGDLGKDAAAR